MAEPIKTTIQEAFDHIKTWIAEGNKDKAIQGLNEILNFDPTNAEAQKLLLEVKTSTVAATSTTPGAPAATTAPTSPTVAAPAPTVPTAPAPMPPPPMPAINVPPEQVSSTTPPSVAPSATPASSAPSVTPPKATPIAPVASTAATPSITEAAGGIMSHMKLIIAIGGVVISLIGGYIFYKNVLADVGVAVDELGEIQESAQEVVEQVESIPTADESTTEATATDESTATPETATETSSTETTPESGTSTDSSTATSGETSDTVEATSGKVKRRE